MKQFHPNSRKEKRPKKDLLVRCKHFPLCGGCENLQRSSSSLFAEKRKDLISLLNDPLIPCGQGLQSPRDHHYRNKVQLPFGRGIRPSRTTSTAIPGLLARDRSHIVPMEECYIQEESLTAIVLAVRQWAQTCKLSPYNERNQRGMLRYILLRRGAFTGEILLTLVVNADRPPRWKRELDELFRICMEALEPFEGNRLNGIVVHGNTMKNNLVLRDKRFHLIQAGMGQITEKIDEFQFQIEPGTFFQTNPYQISGLYSLVTTALEGSGRVLELHAGIAAISHFLSRTVESVVALESNPDSVRLGRQALKNNRITNVELHHLPAAAMGKILKKQSAHFEAIVVDPPREGLDPTTMAHILDMKLQRMVYVSCNPATLLRDIEQLKKKLPLRHIEPVDMFPYTEHLESVAFLGNF